MNEENWEAGIFGIVADNSVRAHREVVRNQAPEPETVTVGVGSIMAGAAFMASAGI